jgi:hypothetical protein
MPLVISSDMVERKFHGKENLTLRKMVFLVFSAFFISLSDDGSAVACPCNTRVVSS